MSRRKEPPPPLAPGATRSFTFKIVCSDRGQHPRIVLHHIADMRSHDYPHGFMALEGRNELRVATAEDGTVFYKFRCPRCLKTPVPVAEPALARIYDEMSAAAGEHHPVLDIAALP